MSSGRRAPRRGAAGGSRGELAAHHARQPWRSSSSSRALPEQDIARIQFLEGPRHHVMLQLAETFGGAERAIDAAVLSDGTLRVLLDRGPRDGLVGPSGMQPQLALVASAGIALLGPRRVGRWPQAVGHARHAP